MAKGGGSSQPVKQEITQSTLPEYARPYFEGLMTRANANLTGPYIPYGYTQDKTTGDVVKALDAQGNPINPQRIADFTPQQQQLQQNILNQQTPGQFGTATGLASDIANRSIAAGQYDPGQFNAQQIGMPNLQQYSMSGPRDVQAQQYGTPQMGAAQTGFSPQVQAYMMGNARDVTGVGVNAPEMRAAQTSYGQGPLEQFRMEGPQAFGLAQAQQYMSPFAEAVMEPQKREAIRSAKQAQIVGDLGAARQGTYGGSRRLLAGLERERNLGQQLGDIDAKGRQAAYESAQQQFERDRAAGMTTGQQNLQAALQQQQLGVNTGLQAALANLSNEQQANVNNQAMQFQARGMSADNAMKAALANQGVDVTRAQANQQAQMQAQQLSTQTGMQTALANLDSASQANVQNLAAQLQTQGLNADQAMRAALANQQAQLTTGQQNLSAALDTQRLGAQTGLAALQSNQQADLERQRMREQSRQFGSQQGLASLAQAGQMAQTLANIGSAQSQADQARFGLQTSTAAQQQALNQQYLDTDYQEFLRQRDYPMEQLQQYSSLLRGVPVTPNSTTSTYAQQPGIGQQLIGTGLGAASVYNTFRGG